MLCGNEKNQTNLLGQDFKVNLLCALNYILKCMFTWSLYLLFLALLIIAVMRKTFCDAPFMFNAIELLLGICSTSNICMVA